MGIPASNAYRHFRHVFNVQAAEDLKLLLETKHLYQKVTVDLQKVLGTIVPSAGDLTPQDKREFDRHFQSFIGGTFAIGYGVLLDQYQEQELSLVVTNVKLFCSKCGGREAFRPIWFSDITNQLRTPGTDRPKFRVAFTRTFQLFSVVYQCQRCEGIPEVFLIKRDALNLSVEGRSPIEHVELPAYIPKDEKKWFRDAVIAFQTGKVLAALFYMRTFVEQFARRKTNLQNDRKTGDEIMKAYSATLPENLRDTMPSLGEWYDKVSEALHGANEDSELFKAAREKIEKHFDIRRVHDLDSRDAEQEAKSTPQ